MSFLTISISHLPYTQTGHSRHYAFVEFEDEEVAKKVAESMNNYILYERVLKCQVLSSLLFIFYFYRTLIAQFIPKEYIHPNLFWKSNKRHFFRDQRSIAAKRLRTVCSSAISLYQLFL